MSRVIDRALPPAPSAAHAALIGLAPAYGRAPTAPVEVTLISTAAFDAMVAPQPSMAVGIGSLGAQNSAADMAPPTWAKQSAPGTKHRSTTCSILVMCGRLLSCRFLVGLI
ncbi:MAG: hypothetical protein Q4F71_00685 [Paracoccus sp. (in: a-proteobacteria)]|nr:hypothetical protein [Paracoccus sp. (in: a-proteobacteria)]